MAGLIDSVDGFQQRHRAAGLVFAVYKKFGDDQAGNLSALISYYAFLSIFPLLLALATILGYVLGGHPHLEERVYSGALGSFPIIGQQDRLHPLTGNALGLVVGLGLALWSGLGVGQKLQTALNVVDDVPRTERPGFAPRLLRSLELVVVVGGGLTLSTLVQGAVSGSSAYGLDLGIGVVILGGVVGVVLNTALLLLTFRRGTARDPSWRELLPGAAVGGVAWFVLQKLGTGLVNSKVSGAQGTYGTFAVVIGLLSWFFLLARVTLYCAELNAVLSRRLWPRGLRTLTGTATTAADSRAYTGYPQQERQVHNVEVQATMGSPAPPVPDDATRDRRSTAGAPADRGRS